MGDPYGYVRRRGIQILLLSLVAFVAWRISVMNLVGGGPCKTNRIINNLRQLDGAVCKWALDHGQPGVVVVTREQISTYLKDGWVRPVAGEIYRLGSFTESPEAQLTREVEGRPKGTVFRWGTNTELEIILPSQGLQPTRPRLDVPADP
jgi:hypothetical protein